MDSCSFRPLLTFERQFPFVALAVTGGLVHGGAGHAARRGGAGLLAWPLLPARGADRGSHSAPELADFATENKAWLRIYRLPAYAPDLNPAEGIWSLLKRAIANFAAADLDGLVRDSSNVNGF